MYGLKKLLYMVLILILFCNVWCLPRNLDGVKNSSGKRNKIVRITIEHIDVPDRNDKVPKKDSNNDEAPKTQKQISFDNVEGGEKEDDEAPNSQKQASLVNTEGGGKNDDKEIRKKKIKTNIIKKLKQILQRVSEIKQKHLISPNKKVPKKVTTEIIPPATRTKLKHNKQAHKHYLLDVPEKDDMDAGDNSLSNGASIRQQFNKASEQTRNTNETNLPDSELSTTIGSDTTTERNALGIFEDQPSANEDDNYNHTLQESSEDSMKTGLLSKDEVSLDKENNSTFKVEWKDLSTEISNYGDKPSAVVSSVKRLHEYINKENKTSNEAENINLTSDIPVHLVTVVTPENNLPSAENRDTQPIEFHVSEIEHDRDNSSDVSQNKDSPASFEQRVLSNHSVSEHFQDGMNENRDANSSNPNNGDHKNSSLEYSGDTMNTHIVKVSENSHKNSDGYIDIHDLGKRHDWGNASPGIDSESSHYWDDTRTTKVNINNVNHHFVKDNNDFSSNFFYNTVKHNGHTKNQIEEEASSSDHVDDVSLPERENSTLMNLTTKLKSMLRDRSIDEILHALNTTVEKNFINNTDLTNESIERLKTQLRFLSDSNKRHTMRNGTVNETEYNASNSTNKSNSLKANLGDNINSNNNNNNKSIVANLDGESVNNFKKNGEKNSSKNYNILTAADDQISVDLLTHELVPVTPQVGVEPSQKESVTTLHTAATSIRNSSEATTNFDTLAAHGQSEDFCAIKQTGTYGNGEDCTKYWLCAAGKMYGTQCPPGLVYNSKIASCDDPNALTATKKDVLLSSCKELKRTEIVKNKKLNF